MADDQGVPVQGIESSSAAFTQSRFDALRQEVDSGTVARNAALHQQTQATKQWFPPPRTAAGPGGHPPSFFTPERTDGLIQQIQASGYKAISLGSALFPFTYSGHMLNPAFHMLDPVFGGLKADYHI